MFSIHGRCHDPYNIYSAPVYGSYSNAKISAKQDSTSISLRDKMSTSLRTVPNLTCYANLDSAKSLAYMQACIYTCLLIPMLTYTHARLRTYTHACLYACLPTYT